MKAAQLARICQGTLVGDGEVAFSGVSIDSRRCGPGEVFFALRGARVDGHAFVESALAAGAALVVVEAGRGVQGARVEVADPLQALQQYAGWVRRNQLGQVVAITGSNGKTMVKDALAAILAGHVRVACSPGSYNSQVGVPLAILSMPEDTEVAILEVGVSAPGEMAAQQRMVQPNFGILTNVGLAHIGAFGHRTTTAREKMQLFEQIDAQGWLLLPSDEPLLEGVEERVAGRIVRCGAPGAVQLTELRDTAAGTRLGVVFPDGEQHTVSVQTRSTQMIGNLLVAMTAGSLLGVPSADIALAMEGWSFGPTRLEMWRSPQGVTLINDAYSADPLSVRAALQVENAHSGSEGKRIFVFGGMHELGDRSEMEHRLIGQLAAQQGITHLLIPPNDSTRQSAAAFVQENPKGTVLETEREQLGEVVRQLAGPGDTLLIKGPRGDGLVKEARRLWETMAGKRLVVDMAAIRENVACFRRLVPGGRILAMLKAWAYGTELGRMSRWLQQSGVDWIGVSAADEGAMVRRAGVHLPILVTLLDAEEIDKVVRYRLTPAVYSRPLLMALEAAAKRQNRPIDVHLKVDTGMGRLGIRPEEVEEVVKQVLASPWLTPTGLMTHLSCADDPGADEFTQAQIARFDDAIATARAAGLTDCICHASATSGAVRFAASRYDMIRVGLGLYGIYPSPAVQEALELQLSLALLGRVVHVAEYGPGQRIGYGGTFVVERENCRIGIVQMGYNDGVPWRLSNRGEVLVGGRKARIVGRVSMDSLAVDLSDLPTAEIGAEVLLFGAHEGGEIRPEAVAEQAGTIPYELLVKIDNRRVQRIFVGD